MDNYSNVDEVKGTSVAPRFENQADPKNESKRCVDVLVNGIINEVPAQKRK